MLKYPRIRVVEVFMGAGEYGNDLMAKAANEIAVKEAWPLLVNVNEHGGWRLEYFFAEGIHKATPGKFEGIIVGTVNDGAVFATEVEALRGHIAKAKLDFFPEVRRPDLEKK